MHVLVEHVGQVLAGDPIDYERSDFAGVHRHERDDGLLVRLALPAAAVGRWPCWFLGVPPIHVSSEMTVPVTIDASGSRFIVSRIRYRMYHAVFGIRRACPQSGGVPVTQP